MLASFTVVIEHVSWQVTLRGIELTVAISLDVVVVVITPSRLTVLCSL